jgi:DNA polymerase-3 subunit delta
MAGASAASGAQLLRNVEKELERGWPAGLTVLTGDDLYHLDRASKSLVAALTRDEASGFGLTVYGDEKIDVAVVVSAARSAGMFSPRRVVFVSDAGALEGEPETLAAFAAAPPPQSFLVVRAPALDKRRKLHQTLFKSGRSLEFKMLGRGGGGGEGDVRQIAREKGLKVDAPTAAFLIQLTGGDLYRLASELDKIRAWLGENEHRVTPEVVREVAASGGLLSGWEVADAVLRRDRAAGLAAARRLVDGGDEPIRIVGGLAWRARVMIQAKALLAEGRRPDEVVRATRAFYYRDALLQGLSRYTVDELLAFPATILQADRTLKSRSIHPRAVLESLVDRLTGGAGESRERK